jgi:PhnB protein
MKLIPYLNYAGNCEEALNHYQKVLGGNIEVQSRYDQPGGMTIRDEYKNKIMHARFYFGGNTIFASDAHPSRAPKGGDNISMSLSIAEDKALEVFTALAEGGNITMPMERQFWGDLFGMFIDKYGINWMVNGEKEQK